MLGALARAHEFDDRELRQREAMILDTDDERRDDGQRQRDLDDEGGACAEVRAQVDRAADLFDIGFHHVHADAAAGHVGDFRGGGEAGREDEAVDLRVGHRHGFHGVDDAFFHGLLADAVGVEAGAVVRDLDDDVAAFMIGAQLDHAGFGLAGGEAFLGGFDAVIAGVADHVRQRILDQLEHLAVELGVLAFHLKVDLLAKILAGVADDAREFLPCRADGLHPRLHHGFLQLARDARKTL